MQIKVSSIILPLSLRKFFVPSPFKYTETDMSSRAVTDDPSIVKANLETFVLDLDALEKRTDRALQNLEHLLERIVVADRSLIIAKLNQTYERAGDAYDEATRAKAANNPAKRQKQLLAAFLTAEEAMDAVGKTLEKEARQRFAVVDRSVGSDHIGDWAKLWLECARNIIKRPTATNTLERALNNIVIIEHLVKCREAAGNVQNKGQHVHGDSRIPPGNAQFDTINALAT